MLAYRLLQAQTQPEFQQVPEPHAAAGQVVVRMAGSGLCHTDFTVISRERSYWNERAAAFHARPWNRRMGGTNRNRSDKFRLGDAVAVNPSWASCGRCHMCRSGEENLASIRKPFALPESVTTGDSAICPCSRGEVSRSDRRSRPGRGRVTHRCRHHDIQRDQAGTSGISPAAPQS